MEIRYILRNLRKEIGLTQAELSEAMGISKSTIAMIESGKRMPSVEMYELIADFFNVDMDYLYGRQEIKKKIGFTDKGEEVRYVSAEDFLYDNGVYQIVSDNNKVALDNTQKERLTNIISILDGFMKLDNTSQETLFTMISAYMVEERKIKNEAGDQG